MVDNAPKTMNERNTLGQCPQGIVHNGGKKNLRFTQVTSVVDNALKTKKDTTSSKHCPTRRQKTSSACKESNANSLQGIWMEDSLIQMPCKELALLQLTDATNVQPCTAGTPKKKANAAALPGFKDRRAFGLSRRMQVHTTSS